MIQWFMQSSADPKKLAMTVRGLLVGVVPVVLFILQVLGITTVNPGDLQLVIDVVVEITQLAFTLIAVCMTLYGLLRKIILTIRNNV